MSADCRDIGIIVDASASRSGVWGAGVTGGRAPDAEPSRALARAVFNWSLVHGFAMLLIDGRLDGMLAAAGEKASSEALLDGAFDAGFEGT